MTDEKNVFVASKELLEEFFEFIKENIIEVKVEVKEKPLLKKTKKLLTEGLRGLADFVENPDKERVLFEIKKQ